MNLQSSVESKTEVTEEFIGGLKQLFEDHYIDIPEEKVDVVDSLANRVDELESKLNESDGDQNVGLVSSRSRTFHKSEDYSVQNLQATSQTLKVRN